MSSTNPGPATTTGVQSQYSAGNLQKDAILVTPTITPTAITASTTSQQSFSGLGLGLVVGDVITSVNPPSYVAGYTIVGATVTAADTIQVTFGNFTSGTPTPPAGAYTLSVQRLMPGFVQPSSYLASF